MRALVVVLSAALVVSPAACSAERSASAPSSTTESPLITQAPAGSNAADVTFGTNLLELQQQAIHLAGLAASRSSDPQLTDLAQAISTGQTGEADTVKVLLVQWTDGATPSTRSTAVGTDPATLARLESLQGSEFDRLWVPSMIALHQGAIAAAEAEISGGHNVDAKTLAKTIVDTRQAQLQQLQQMMG